MYDGHLHVILGKALVQTQIYEGDIRRDISEEYR